MSRLTLWYQLNIVGLEKPVLIRTHADEIGPDMPTIRYGEAEHPGPFHGLSCTDLRQERKILRDYGDRIIY